MKGLAILGAKTLYLDVTDQKSCEDFVRAAYEQTGRIDILINNAGYGEYGPIETVSEEIAKREMDTVVFGAVRMAKLCAPVMREQGEGRIINVISAGGRATTYMGGWYHASKYAMETLSDSLRMELKPFGIRVVAIEPGGVRTGFGEKAAKNLRTSVGNTIYEKEGTAVADVYSKVYGEKNKMLTSCEKTAKVIFKAATVKRPQARYLFGFGARGLVLMRAVLPQEAYDGLMKGMYSSDLTQKLIK